MLKLRLVPLIIVAAIGLSACNLMTPDVEETKPEDAKTLVDSLVFVKSNKGLCFGVTTISKLSTGGTASYSQIVVLVPCEKVGL